MKKKKGALAPEYPKPETEGMSHFMKVEPARGGEGEDGIRKVQPSHEMRTISVDPEYNQKKDDYNKFQRASNPWKPKGRK